MKTFIPKAADIDRKWYVVDADGMVLGRLASQVANILRGKNKPIYTPNMDTVINCASCGKKLAFGDSYTSRCIHNATGFGYAVCAGCNDKEFEAEKAAYKENDQ